MGDGGSRQDERRRARSLSTDHPKEHLNQDRLGYAEFATALGRGISEMAPSEGIVIALHGVWGSGKTSAVNMAVEAISQIEQTNSIDGKLIVVRFNP